MPEILLEGVLFDYPGGVDVYPSPGLSLRLSGGAIALVGENGAGKSTLTKLLNGLLRPRMGTIAVAGIPVAQRTVAQMAPVVGYSFQNPDDQVFERTVEAEVSFGPRAMGRHGEEVRGAVARALAACELTERALTHPHDLGLPERKWVTIASALAAEASVLVLDEPTLGQDAASRERLARLVKEQAKEGRLVLIVTHDMDFVAECCETTAMLAAGRLEYVGPTAQAFHDEPRLRRCGLEPPHSARLARALGADRPPVGEDAFAEWWASRA